MKISVCGKGGSGKSAIATLLANCMRDKGYHVLVVDSDESNSGLYRMLGFEKPPIPILELVGGKKEVKSIFPKTPLAESEGVINVIARSQIPVDDIPPQYIARRDGLSLVCIGKILQSLEGCACPMGVLSREFLRKLQLKENEIAVVDMEAGVEHFGRGVETSIDIVLLVVDPSFESLELAGRVKTMTGEIGIGNTQAILNKVTSDDMAVKLKEELRKRDMPTIGCIAFDSEILEAGLEGRLLQSNNTREAVERIVDTLLSDSGKHG
jgi:CO dehydrogenase maturation factor